ncbi:MAG: YidC/Oxa1 family rane protein insertase [Alphaproteobacteria bacterium]|nr:YidC/Oxa1 family rane protein insertase [Alphaproteobacteria bacterium]
MNDQKNTLLFIALSAVILIGWQVFFGLPQMEKQKLQQQQQQTTPTTPTTPGTPPVPGEGSTPAPAPAPLTREAALAQSPRVAVQTPRVAGSIALKGGRIDDLALTQYRETIDPNSPPIVLLSPSGSPQPFYAEFGWLPAPAVTVKRPDENTVWTQQGTGALTVDHPVVLVYDNGEGLEFRRTITVDDKYLFTVRDEVFNKGSAPVALHAFALISRHGTPKLEGFYILHEGLIGVLNDKLQEDTYADIEKKKTIQFPSTSGWLGITDKYWAATLLPDPALKFQAQFSAYVNGIKRYQTLYYLDPVTIAPGASAAATARLFAGAKEVSVVEAYKDALGLDRFDKVIDWGYFHFITKPLFITMDWIYHRVGNFGLAILLITVLIKIVFFPLANKSYASMAKMKAVQPEMVAIRERYADDKMKQQQAMMELYKKEKINPVAGCLPILIQIPVFFALYKVLFITIEMRQQPFFGWIKDLSAPDPTTIFNLFGLIPWDPTVVPLIGPFLHLGAWPLVMGVTMWFQMKLNPPPPDPTQKMIFDWMPVIFTFMLAGFSAGLVIYWAWNNTLSVLQQSVIMQKHGAKVELFDNIRKMFAKKSVKD